MSLLELSGLSVTVGAGDRRIAAVSGVDLAVERGEVIGLVGESGAGKTMLARAVAGLLPPTANASGVARFDGRDVLTMGAEALRRHHGEGAALCFQNPRSALSPVRRVGDQVADRLRAHRRADGPEIGWTPLSLFEAVGIRNPEARLASYPHELSGGMAQRVMIALALACSPAMLVADEPTTGLDVTLTRSILALLRTAASEWNRAVLIISHDLAAIAEVCDRIAVLYAGTLVEEGATGTLLAQPTHPYTAALLAAAPDVSGEPTRALGGAMPTLSSAPAACPFAPRCPLVRDICRQSVPRLVATAIGSRSACFVAAELAAGGDGAPAGPEATVAAPLPSAAGPAAPILRVADVAVVYRARFGRGGTRALRGVSLSVHRGETIGVVGESGCGKSTLARVMLGLVPPTSGAVELDGVELTALGAGAMRRLRRRIQMVFQDPVDSLNPRRSVEATLRDSLRLLELTPGEVSQRIDDALARVALDPALRPRRRNQLSGGQAQRVGIARALVLDPDVVVFDEPTSALDVTVQAQILELIESLIAGRERSYVYISHDLATVRRIADRVAVLYLGKVVEEGPVDDVFDHPLHPYTRALLASAPSLLGTRVVNPVVLRQELESSDVDTGCALAPRCPFALQRCIDDPQQLDEVAPGRAAACWRVGELEASVVAIPEERA